MRSERYGSEDEIEMRLFKRPIVLLGIVASSNLLLWLFVNAVDMTTIGAGRARYPQLFQSLLKLCDQLRPGADFILSPQRLIDRSIDPRGTYYLSWLVTIVAETLAIGLLLVALVAASRICFCRIRKRTSSA